MRFVFLTQYYPPETGAPQNRLSDLARRLAAAGHGVTVLTAKPNYPRGEIHAEFRGGLWRERRDGATRVIHCWLVPSKSKRVAMRLVNYFSFVMSSALIGALTLSRADVVFVESPPLFLGATGWFLARVKRAAMIFNVSDLYPETAVSLGYLRAGTALRALTALELWCYRQSALVTAQTEGIVRSIRARSPATPVHLLTNGVDPQEFRPIAAQPNGNRPFTVGYAGILGHAQGLPAVLDAARVLHARNAAVRFEFFGDGPLREDLESRARRDGLSNVRFAGHRSRADVLDAMRHWDAGLVPLVRQPLMAGALPSKMFEMMAASLAVVLSAPEGEASRVINGAEAGVHVEAENPEALARALEDLANDRARAQAMGRRARAHVLTHYDRAAVADAFLAAVRQHLGVLS